MHNQSALNRAVLFSTCAAALAAPPTFAQKNKPVPGKKPAAAAQAVKISAATFPTLDKALAQVAWNPAKGGALLVVDPAGTAARAGVSAVATGRLTLPAVAPLFERKVVPLGSVSVLAPTRMVVLSALPDQPDLFAGLNRAEKVRFLMSTLSTEQWQKLGSAQGLGREDLDTEQQRRFNAILPDPFRVARYRRDKTDAPLRRQAETPTLTAQQRSGVRLRVRRAVDMLLFLADKPGAYAGFTRRYEGREIREMALIEETPGERQQRRATDLFGASARQTVPNEPKPGELPFDLPALSASVSLTGVGTLGDLIKRVGQATNLELFADRRVARLPVRISGASAKAGDILKGISLAVTGTFRKISDGDGPPAWILTDDLVGLGARQVGLAEWYQETEARKRALFEEAADKTVSLGPMRFIPFADSDPLAPDATLKKQLDGHWAKDDPRFRIEVPVAELPPGLQAYVREEAARRADGLKASQPPVRTDRVKLGVHLRFSYLVPGIGEAEESFPELGEAWRFLPRPIPLAEARRATPLKIQPFALPSGVQARGLMVAPRNADEAARLAMQAQQRGFNQLWVDAAHPSAVSAATQAGKTTGLQVFAVVRLLKPQSGAGDLDRTILGVPVSQTARPGAAAPKPKEGLEALLDPEEPEAAPIAPHSDWLSPTAANPELLKKRLTALAQTPGLAGVVLQDTLPPGYGEYEAVTARRSSGGNSAAPAAAAEAATAQNVSSARYLGYTPQMRLEFLRRENVDPVDLVPPGVNRGIGDSGSPFFASETSSGNGANGRPAEAAEPVARRWSAFKRAANQRLMTEVFTALRAARNDLPLLIRNRNDDQRVGESRRPIRWYAGWERADALPEVAPGSTTEDPLRRVGSQFGRLVLALNWTEPRSAQDTQWFLDGLRAFTETVENSRAAQGFVLDLSEMSAEKAQSLLEGINPAAPK